MANPTFAAIILGRKLRQLRVDAGYGQTEASQLCRFAKSKLSDIENGKVRVSMFDIMGMCGIYNAPNDLRDELVRMADEAAQPGWWEEFSTVMLKDFSVRLELEAVCRTLWAYESEIIPGLLQTEAYANAVQAAYPLLNGDKATDAVTLRMERQRRFWPRDPFPATCFIFPETVLDSPLCDEEQRDRLVKASKTADIRVIPKSVGAHASMRGSYALLESGIEVIPDVVYLENLHGCRYEEAERTLNYYRELFEASRISSQPIGKIIKC